MIRKAKAALSGMSTSMALKVRSYAKNWLYPLPQGTRRK